MPFFSYVIKASRNFLAQTMREGVPSLVFVIAFDIGGLRDETITFIQRVSRIYVRTSSIGDYEAFAFSSVKPCCAKRGST